MAFDLNPNSTRSTGSNNDESWKSQAFINIYLPGRNGNRRKLGSIGLKVSKPAEKELIEFLQADPERITELMAHAEVDFQLVNDTESNGFDLAAVGE